MRLNCSHFQPVGLKRQAEQISRCFLSRVSLAPYWLACAFLLAIAVPQAYGDITLPTFFSDHMVIQQKAKFPVWGTAEPNQVLIVRFNEAVIKTTATTEGKFSVSIPTPAAGGPFNLEVADENEANKVVLTDVMVGDVWLCAGQSSMGIPVSQALNAETEIELSKKFGQIRLLKLQAKANPQAAQDVITTASWETCSPESVKNFSAVAYFFGRTVAQSLDKTPIGLVQADADGSACEAWCSVESMSAKESLEPLLSHWQENEDPDALNRPGGLFNGVIAPLAAYPIRGVIWYQGEANIGRGKQYADLFPCLIENWRDSFATPDLPFYFVQLPPFRHVDYSSVALPEIWDAQLQTMKTVPATAMAPTQDIGEGLDAQPKNKQLIGRRLANIALSKTYQSPPTDPTAEPQTQPFTGPVYESVAYREGTIRVTFLNVGTGLKQIGIGEIESFAVCGEDEVYHPATVKIVGPASVELTCEEVASPKR